MRLLTCHAHSGARVLVLALTLLLASCSLPAIHRESAPDASDSGLGLDAGQHAGDAARTVDQATGDDAGPSADPEHDPANRNESLDAFQALVPKQHLFAEWPMPDSAPHSQHKPSYTVSELVVVDNVTKLRWQRDLPDVYPGCQRSRAQPFRSRTASATGHRPSISTAERWRTGWTSLGVAPASKAQSPTNTLCVVSADIKT